jgi:hypothetical protein
MQAIPKPVWPSWNILIKTRMKQTSDPMPRIENNACTKKSAAVMTGVPLCEFAAWHNVRQNQGVL